MSRREEVDGIIKRGGDYDTNCLARTLADEVDAMRAENAELKAQYLHVAELNHNQVSMVRADCTHLAAANATLDALRELFAPDKIISNSTCMKAVDILYPSIRDIADRHGFAPMPAELGQQNVNDHTTTAALAKENDNGN